MNSSPWAAYVYKGSRYPSPAGWFHPIEELATTAGDTALVFLSANRVLYNTEINDDWYSAHQANGHNLSSRDSQSPPFFLADEPASVLGCNILYQVCDPTKPPEQGCSALGGTIDMAFVDTPPRTQREKAQNWILATYTDIANVVRTLKYASLTSRFRISGSVQGALPVNQWQQEVENWHNVAMNTLQAGVVINAAGPGDPELLESFWTPPSDEISNYICKNQVCTLY